MSDYRKRIDLFEEQRDFIEQKVSYGIETYRKGTGKIRIVDQNGTPVSNARVRLCQTSHEFRFGANLFMLDEMESDEKNEKYKQCFTELFNMATLPFYWNTLEPVRGYPRYGKDSEKIYRRPSPDLCLEFCEKHGIEPREHGLAYEPFFPKWLCHAGVDEVKKELERHFSEISERYADKIPTVEVTNEMNWVKGVTAFYDDFDYVEYCFKLAEKYFPHNSLCINEATKFSWIDNCRTTDKYYAYIEANMGKGARIDAIGMQYHLFYKKETAYEDSRMTLNPQNLYRHMDLYAHLGKPLQITEVTVPAYSWEAEDEEIQAELIEKLYSIWFSHPSVEQIIYWNLADGYAHVWDPALIKGSQGNMTLGENYYHGGLLRFDLSPKPAYFKLKELLQKTWHTEETLMSDEKGSIEFRGFFGDYTVKIDTENGTLTQAIKLSKKEKNSFVFIV